MLVLLVHVGVRPVLTCFMVVLLVGVRPVFTCVMVVLLIGVTCWPVLTKCLMSAVLYLLGIAIHWKLM